MFPPQTVKTLGILFLLFLCCIAFGAMLFGTSSRFDNHGYVKIDGYILKHVAYPSTCSQAAQCYDIYVKLIYGVHNEPCYLETMKLATNETTALALSEEMYPIGSKMIAYRKIRTTTCIQSRQGDGEAIAGVVLLVFAGLLLICFPCYLPYIFHHGESDAKISPEGSRSRSNIEFTDI